MTAWLGIDPGKDGGMALMTDRGDVFAEPLPIIDKRVDPRAFRQWIVATVPISSVRAAVEKAQAVYIPPERLKANPGAARNLTSSSFSYGFGYGFIVGLLTAWDVPVVEIHPRSWQAKVLGTGKTGKSKDAAIARVQFVYPMVDLTPGRKRKPHDGTADAVCIAEWCRLWSPFKQ